MISWHFLLEVSKFKKNDSICYFEIDTMVISSILWWYYWYYGDFIDCDAFSAQIPNNTKGLGNHKDTNICLKTVNEYVSYHRSHQKSKAWWHQQIETFSVLLVLCEGNPPVTHGFHSQRPVTQSFDAFFDLCVNKRLSKQSWCQWFEMPSCSLWHHGKEKFESIKDGTKPLLGAKPSAGSVITRLMSCIYLNWWVSARKM